MRAIERIREQSLLICLLVLPGLIQAGGFQVNLQGNKQTGMGHTGTALNMGASTVFFNPGAMTFQDTTWSLEAGFNGIYASTVFQSDEFDYSASTIGSLGTPFHVYVSGKITDKIGAGLAVYTPFGSKVEWEGEWKGRFLIQDIQLQAIFIQPTFSYKINDSWGVGAGFVYALGSVEINRNLPLEGLDGEEGTVNLTGDAAGIGFNIGFYGQPTEKLSVGLTYRSQVDIALEGGDAKFTAPSSLAASFPADNKFDADLPLPATGSLGLAYDVSDKVKLAFDINYVFWSVYDSLIFDFETNTSALSDSRNARLYEDAIIIRLGGEFKCTDNFIWRLGAYYDPSPIQDDFFNPETPNTDNVGFTVGASIYPTERLAIDLSFLYILGLERESTYEPSNFGGTYKSSAHIPGVGLSYSF